jgi:hypothetical protein
MTFALRLPLVAAVLLMLIAQAGDPVLIIPDGGGAAGLGPVPVSVEVDLSRLLPQLFQERSSTGDPAGAATRGDDGRRLQLESSGATGAPGAGSIPAQFEAETPGGTRGTLWFLLPPPSGSGESRFRLKAPIAAAQPVLSIRSGETNTWHDIVEGAQPVLRYHQGTVPVPPGIGTNYARGDYIMPLYGPSGEVLTDDYPPDHPHHRGLGWSWPVTRWGNEVRDIWAVVGVWARPVAMRRTEGGPVFALLEAENVWKWGDTEPIVREAVRIRAFRSTPEGRWIDIELRLTALADGVAIGGRPHGGYGGFGLRARPAEGRVITRFTDPAGIQPRRSWLDYSGVFAGGKGPAGLAIFEHPANPLYPSELKEYPELNYVMPAFPGEREVPLARDRALVLKHRVWVHPGMAPAEGLARAWAAYVTAPRAIFEGPARF